MEKLCLFAKFPPDSFLEGVKHIGSRLHPHHSPKSLVIHTAYLLTHPLTLAWGRKLAFSAAKLGQKELGLHSSCFVPPCNEGVSDGYHLDVGICSQTDLRY